MGFGGGTFPHATHIEASSPLRNGAPHRLHFTSFSPPRCRIHSSKVMSCSTLCGADPNESSTDWIEEIPRELNCFGRGEARTFSSAIISSILKKTKQQAPRICLGFSSTAEQLSCATSLWSVHWHNTLLPLIIFHPQHNTTQHNTRKSSSDCDCIHCFQGAQLGFSPQWTARGKHTNARPSFQQEQQKSSG